MDIQISCKQRITLSLIFSALVHVSLLFVHAPTRHLTSLENADSILRVSIDKKVPVKEPTENETPPPIASKRINTEQSEPEPILLPQARAEPLEDKAESSAAPSQLVVSPARLKQWISTEAKEQSDAIKYTDISQPRQGTLARSYIDALAQRRKTQAAPVRHDYGPGKVLSFRLGNKRYCYLGSFFGLGFSIQPVKCGRNIRANPLSHLIPQKSQQASPSLTLINDLEVQ